MLVEFSIVHLSPAESKSANVARIIDLVDKSGLPYKFGPMATVVEGEWDEVMALIKRCHETALEGAPRLITSIKIDDRPGKPNDRLSHKTKSVQEKLGREVKT